MLNIKVYESFIKESPDMDNTPQVMNTDSSVSIPSGPEPITREQEAMRARLEADVKRMYPNLSIRHTQDGQSGVAIDNNVIYASDHYEAFNAFLFGLVVAKMQEGPRNNMIQGRY